MKHKCIKFLIATVVLINLLFSETYIAEMTTNELKIEEISKNQQIQLEIAHYLEDKAREPNKDIQEYETQLSELEQNQINRATAMWNLEEIADLQFEKIEISFEINDILEQTRSEILLEVYEWTSIYYYASSERIELDMMGYGVYHTMSFAIEGEQYTLVKDSFDESFMTGIKSVDYVADEKENTVKSDSLVMSVEENSEIRGVLETYENENITYDVNAAINYANQYCGASISNSSYSNINGVTALDDNNPNGYEPRFRRVDVTYFPGRDCANFVSQCMWAGNLWQDNIWNVDPDNDSDFNPTVTWINARALKNHFTSERKYKYEPIIYNDNYTNMFPGNPVCWINRSGSPSGHQMICTGYNSNGVPVLNGHNDDMFRVPYTVSESVAASLDTEAHNNDGLYTILVVSISSLLSIPALYISSAIKSQKWLDLPLHQPPDGGSTCHLLQTLCSNHGLGGETGLKAQTIKSFHYSMRGEKNLREVCNGRTES